MIKEPCENIKKQNLQLEKEQHQHPFYIDSGHWTSHPLLASRQRHWLCYDVQKIRFYGDLSGYIKKKAYKDSANILLAPVGNGQDIFYLHGVFKKIYGIDISAIKLAECPRPIITKEADILFSGYEDQSFDIIVCAHFLHHIQDVGFQPFIKEFSRLLRKGGTLAILEPSNLYPFGWIIALARKIMGNVTGQVESERPIFPGQLTSELRKMGFKKIRVRGITLAHMRFPSPMQHLLNALDCPFRFLFPFKLFANFVGWYCIKP